MAEDTEETEPSMDNILSSIRKILSEDEQSASEGGESSSAVAQPVAAQNQPKQEKDMVAAMEVSDPGSNNEVSESQKETPENVQSSGLDVSTEQETVLDGVAGQSPGGFPNDGSILELTQQMIAQPPPDIGAGDTILSSGPSVNSTDALQELAKALLSKRDIAIGNKDMTLEGLVREILRPLLREWLDQNLPYLIERLVKKEIDHMVNRAERLDL
ncbi:MAG: DUF2497 domain-containing protein [Pseudomonadota bacterium]|nr:DUF2497 domain-containing protein [Pseudomonadota bacterium]